MSTLINNIEQFLKNPSNRNYILINQFKEKIRKYPEYEKYKPFIEKLFNRIIVLNDIKQDDNIKINKYPQYIMSCIDFSEKKGDRPVVDYIIHRRAKTLNEFFVKIHDVEPISIYNVKEEEVRSYITNNVKTLMNLESLPEKTNGVIFLSGPASCGKSNLIHWILKNYVNVKLPIMPKIIHLSTSNINSSSWTGGTGTFMESLFEILCRPIKDEWYIIFIEEADFLFKDKTVLDNSKGPSPVKDLFNEFHGNAKYGFFILTSNNPVLTEDQSIKSRITRVIFDQISPEEMIERIESDLTKFKKDMNINFKDNNEHVNAFIKALRNKILTDDELIKNLTVRELKNFIGKIQQSDSNPIRTEQDIRNLLNELRNYYDTPHGQITI